MTTTKAKTDEADAPVPAGHVRIQLAHPYATELERYEANEAALQANPPMPGQAPPQGHPEEHKPGTYVVVPENEARTLIGAGYAAVDAEDTAAVEDALTP